MLTAERKLWGNLLVSAVIAISVNLSMPVLAAPNLDGPETPNGIWRDRVQHPDGYMEVRGTTDQVTMIRKFLEIASHSRPLKGVHLPVSCQMNGGFVRASSLTEMDRRETVIFRRGESLAMLTVWELNDEQRVTTAKDFLNVSVRGQQGTQSLVRTRGNPGRALWKVTWLSGRTNFEMYLEDSIAPDDKPTLHPAEVLKLAESLSCR